MGFLDKLFGRAETPVLRRQPAVGSQVDSQQSADERALAQYRYMLQTAPPQAIEQAHAEAFAKLSPEQRSMLLQQLSAELPEAERSVAGVTAKDDPRSLARLATRAEVRQPGTMERTFGGMGGRGMGMGGMMAGSFLSTIAGVVVGSAIAQSFLGESSSGGEHSTADNAASDQTADAGSDMDGDFDGGFDGDNFA